MSWVLNEQKGRMTVGERTGKAETHSVSGKLYTRILKLIQLQDFFRWILASACTE